MTTESFILTAISVIAALGSLLSLRSNNKRIDTESRKLEDEITERVLARASAENKRLEDRLTECEAQLAIEHDQRRSAEKKNEIYLNGIYLLTNQLIRNDLAPCWKPAETGPLGKVAA